MQQRPVIEKHGEITVVRDDLYPGGTKARVLAKVLKSHKAEEFVYPATAHGYGGLALAYAGRDLQKKVILYTAARGELTPILQAAKDAGAELRFVSPGYLNINVVPTAKRYAGAHPESELLPLGFSGLPGFEEELVKIAHQLPLEKAPKEVWTVGGSGTLTRALQKAWPDAKFYVVDVVKNHQSDFGKANVIEAPQKFEQRVRKDKRPPFNSAANYDAKAWEFVREKASPGALFWNVGGELAQKAERAR